MNQKANNRIYRLISALIMTVLIIYGYWWMPCIFAIFLLFYFKRYYEFMIWGIVYDALYSLTLPEYWNINFVFTFSSIIIFIVISFLKTRLITYDDLD